MNKYVFYLCMAGPFIGLALGWYTGVLLDWIHNWKQRKLKQVEECQTTFQKNLQKYKQK